MKYGYVRVSSKDQNEMRQLIALDNSSKPEMKIFTDKVSGKNFQRPAYKKMLEELSAGDSLYITAIDRLGRNYDEIQTEWHRITKDIGADIIVLDMPLLDTRRKPDDLTGKFIADLVLQILSYVAEKERMNIRQRQAEGIKAAKERGVKLGSERTVSREKFSKLYEKLLAGEMTRAELIKELKVTPRTYCRYVADYKNNKECDNRQ